MYFVKIYNPTRTELLAKFSRYISLEYDDQLNQPSDGTMKVSIEDFEANFTVFEKFNRMSVFKDGIEKWRGFISDVKNNDTIVTIYFTSTLGFLKKRHITKEYASQNVVTTFKDVLDTMNDSYPTEFIYGGTDLVGTSEEFNFEDTQVYEALQSIAKSQAAEVSVVNLPSPEIDGMKLRYQFDEGGGTDVFDSSGSKNNGVITGVTRVAYEYGYALRYVGNNAGYYLSTDYHAVDGLGDFSLYCRATYVAGLSTQPVIWSFAQASNTNEFILLFTPAANTWQIYIKGVIVFTVVDTTFNDGLLHSILIEREGTNLKFFIDGVQKGATTTVTNEALGVDEGGFIIGQEQDTVGGGFQAAQSWSGDIGDVRVFDRALTQLEKDQLEWGILDRDKTEVWLLSQTGEDKSDLTQPNGVAFKYIEERMFETNIEKPDYSEEGMEMANYIIAKNNASDAEKKTSIQSDVPTGKDRIEKVIVFRDITSQDALDAAALDYLEKHKNPRKNPRLDVIAQKLDESLYSVGDLCKIRLKYGFVDLDVNYRVVRKSYEVDNGGEDVKVVVETSNNSLTRENFYQRIADMDKRLADLEK